MSASVTARALSILAAFDTDHPRLTLSEIARRAGLPLATAHRLTRNLEDWRALERGTDGSYRIGRRLWELGRLSDLEHGLRRVALPYLHDLHEATRENVHLAVRDGADALYVERLPGRRSVPTDSEVGGRLPLHATGVGKVLLAYAEPEVRAAVLRRPLTRPTRFTVVEPGRLTRQLEEVRRTGVARTREEMTLGSCGAAVPVTGPDGEVVAAVGIVVRTVQGDLDRWVPALRAAAAGISRGLSGSPDRSPPADTPRPLRAAVRP